MEGKAYIVHLPAGFGALHAVDCIVTYRLFPTTAIHRVQEIIVDIIEDQTVELLIEEAIKIFRRFIKPCGRFSGHIYLFAIAVLKGLTQNSFRIAAYVVISRIEVIDPTVDGRTDHRYRCIDIDLIDGVAVYRFAAIFHGKAHNAKAQRRNLHARIAESTQFHDTPPVFVGYDALSPMPHKANVL